MPTYMVDVLDDEDEDFTKIPDISEKQKKEEEGSQRMESKTTTCTTMRQATRLANCGFRRRRPSSSREQFKNS